MDFNFQDAKYGMFIHWGLYSKVAKGEWYMCHKKVSVKEYEKIADDFNPVSFDAESWVALAKAAGMKYIVITAKHHEGFAMYCSAADSYNIVERTPFGRDPMLELRDACEKEGIQLCFYYSHVIDWHHPHALHEVASNTWDYNNEEKDFYIYWNEKAKPQVRELLENYGPIGLIWFDTAGNLSRDDSLNMYRLVKSIQPGCLVNSRLSHVPGMGDYAEKGDNEIPMLGDDDRPWQTPMTLNRSWGYEEREQDWKPVKILVYKLINIISKGGNYLLNVGPTAEGVIPAESEERLREVGTWIGSHEESIYGTHRTPFPYEHTWGGITARGNRLYLHLFNENVEGMDKLYLMGVRNKIRKMYFLSNGEKLYFTNQNNKEFDVDKMVIHLPAVLPDKYVSTIVLEVEGDPDVDQRLIQDMNGINLSLTAAALIDKTDGDDIDGGKTAQWDFLMLEPGEYSVELVNFKKFNAEWEYGEVTVGFGGEEYTLCPAMDSVDHDSPSCQHPYEQVFSRICNINIDKPGLYTITLKGALVGKKPRNFEAWQAPKYRIRSLQISKAR